MKRIAITFCATAFLFACNSEQKVDEPKVASATSEPKDQTKGWEPVDSATAEKAWMEYMTPGESHKLLAKATGEWNGEMIMWMAPDASPMTSKITGVNKMIMGDRYQVSNYKGNFMGMPFEGTSTTAYDNAKKVFVNTWIDNMGTGIMTMEGTWNEASKAISFKGKMICPANGKECDVRETYQIIDNDTHLLSMYGPDMKTGKEYKNMEIKFTRKK
jgi:hypothetical protein